jgi:hypothetical protein
LADETEQRSGSAHRGETTIAAHRLVGYDKKSKNIDAEYEVPLHTFTLVCHTAGVPYDNPDATGSYPLSPLAAQEIGKMIGAQIDTINLSYILEPALSPGTKKAS